MALQALVRREEGDICRRNQAAICLIFLKNCVLVVVIENFLGEFWICIIPIIFIPPVPSAAPFPNSQPLIFYYHHHIYIL